MNQFMQWLSMGGYASYIWPAYGLVGIVLVMNIVGIKWQKKQTRLELQRWFKRSQPHGADHKMPLDP